MNIDTYHKIAEGLEKENGPLLIFGLFQILEPLEIWDILVSAPWLNTDKISSYDIIAKKLRDHLETVDMLEVSRIVILNADDHVVSYLRNLEYINKGNFKKLDVEELSDKFNFIIKKAYLLRS